MLLHRLVNKLTFCFLAFASLASAQLPDIRLTQGSKYVAVRNVSWATNFNRTYVLVPLNPEISVCVNVVNNNPTTGHSFTLQVFQTNDGQPTDFTNNQGRYLPTTLNGMTAPQNVGAASTVSGFSSTTSAAQIAFKFTGGLTAAGSPDTADIVFVQTTSGTCGTSSGGVGVQGVAPNGSNGTLINPVLTSGLQLPVNSNFAQVGIDNASITEANIPNQSNFTFTLGTPPRPSSPNELGLAFLGVTAGTGGTIGPPWASVAGSAGLCSGGSPQFCAAFVNNVQSNSVLQQVYGNSFGGHEIAQFLDIGGTSPTVRQANIGSATGVVAFSSNTAAGSLLIASIGCATFPCSVSNVTDTQGLTWKQIGARTNSTAFNGVITWAATTTSGAAADTVTATLGSGTFAGTIIIEVSGVTQVPFTQPELAYQVDPLGAQVIRQDAQASNQFACAVAISTNTTTQCLAAPGFVSNVPVRAYITDIQIQTTVAGTASTVVISTGTGTNCATGLAALQSIQYSTATVGLQNILGMRTPLVAPLQTAVCITQAGTAASTSNVELHGFLAP